MAIEKTLVLIKPDGIKRRLSGLAIDRLDNAGFEMVGAKMVSVTEELARAHYIGLKDLPYYERLIKYIKGDFHDIPKNRLLALVYKGENAIKGVRAVVGATHPEEAAPGTIRSAFGRVNTKTANYENVVHASGDEQDAKREVALWFRPEEIVE